MPEEPTAIDELSPQQLDELPEHLEDQPEGDAPASRRPAHRRRCASRA